MFLYNTYVKNLTNDQKKQLVFTESGSSYLFRGANDTRIAFAAFGTDYTSYAGNVIWVDEIIFTEPSTFSLTRVKSQELRGFVRNDNSDIAQSSRLAMYLL